MRPGQQNNNNNNNKNRQRGRSNNNGGRKHMNPLSRNYESNGPDVKVRGNAAHVAEKYVQLARDAHSSGDSVMAENYLQHAEHYFRILSAAQPQPQRLDAAGQETEAEDADNEDFGADEQSRFDTPTYRANLQNDRQYQDGPPQQQNGGDRQQFNQGDRNNQQGDRNTQQGERQQFNQQQPRNDQQPRFEQPPRVETAGAETGESPETLAADDASMEAMPAPQQDSNEQGGEQRRRERRPRRRRPQMAEGDNAVDPNGPQPDVGELPAFITAGGNTNPAE
ncbi:MAG: DUF4167 domain-containing protein [Devosia sp.]